MSVWKDFLLKSFQTSTETIVTRSFKQFSIETLRTITEKAASYRVTDGESMDDRDIGRHLWSMNDEITDEPLISPAAAQMVQSFDHHLKLTLEDLLRITSADVDGQALKRTMSWSATGEKTINRHIFFDQSKYVWN